MTNKVFISAQDLFEYVPLHEFHIHTDYSDGKNTIKEYVLKAINEKYSAICFTDHVDLSTNWFEDYKKEIFKINNKCSSLLVYCGLEVRARDYNGRLNAREKILNKADIIIGVVHSIPSADGEDKYDPKKFSMKELLKLEYKATMGLLQNPLIDILGHPMGNYEKYFGKTPGKYYRKILETAKKKNVAIELNPEYQYSFNEFLKLNLSINPLVSLGSNAHSVLEFGRSVQKIKNYHV